MARGLLRLPASRNGNLTGSLCGEATTLCLEKEEDPAPGGLDAEARRPADEAKLSALLVSSLDASRASPSPSTKLPYASFSQ